MAIADIPTTFICVNEQKYKKDVIFYTYLNMNFPRSI